MGNLLFAFLRSSNSVISEIICLEDFLLNLKSYAWLYKLEAQTETVGTAPKTPQIEGNRKYPPKPAELPPNQPKKFCSVPEVYKMTQVLKDGRENGVNNQFSIEIFVCKFEGFLKIVNF